MKKLLISLAILILVVYAVAIKYKIYFNIFSDSMPVGLYQITNQPIEEGVIVATCLNEDLAQYGLKRGYLVKGKCRTKIQPVIKPVFGVPGDTFSIIDGKLAKNGRAMGKYPILNRDSSGRVVRRFYDKKYTLKEGEYWLMSDYKLKSWDSRYWGGVPIVFSLKPILTV